MSPRSISILKATPIIALILTLGCAVSVPPRMYPSGTVSAVPKEIRVRVAGRIVTVAFEDYVAGTALSEISPVGETAATIDRVFDVQTTVARTYALAHLGRHRAEGFDLCDSTHCQLYEPARLGTSRFAGDARRSVARTTGNILMYGGRPIDAVFHADCGGHTAAAEDVWGTPAQPYLKSEPDRAPSLTHRSWSVTLTREQVRTALNADSRSAVGRTLTSIDTHQTDGSGRVAHLTIAGEHKVELTGDEFRTIVNRTLGPKGLASTRFTMETNRAGFVVTGTGYGHGVGLCQLGAMARARLGKSPDDIMSTYFPGARVTRLKTS